MQILLAPTDYVRATRAVRVAIASKKARSATPPYKQRSYFQDALHELLKAREEPKFLGRFVEFRSGRSSI
jgi:hypothetical protein